MTREAIIVNKANGNRPILDVDPVYLESNGDVASCWDHALMAVLGTMIRIEDDADDLGFSDPLDVALVWSDTRLPVLLECPGCDSITVAAQFDVDDAELDEPVAICYNCKG